MSVVPVLSARLSAAAFDAFGLTVDPELRAATKPEFGHFQTSLALRLAKQLGQPPRAIAEQLVAQAHVGDLCRLEIAGAGFVNVTLLPSTLAAEVNDLPTSLPRNGRTVVVDYSQPNVAKQMHVGHLRSTVIGDALCNVLEYAGYAVVRQNHVGDWGTQFGMMVEQLLAEGTPAEDLDLEEMQQLYQRSRRHFDSDPVFAGLSRRRVVLLQSGDAETRGIWQQLVDISLTEFDRVYTMLGSPLTQADVVGESAYNADLPGIVDDLRAAGLLTESEGAQCAFLDGFTGRDGSPLPVIVRKSDGGFGYSATDLAAVRHRVRDCTPTGSSTSSTTGSRCTSSRSSRSPGRPAGCLRQQQPSTSRSAPCSGRTASRSRPGTAGRSIWSPCSTPPSNGPPHCLLSGKGSTGTPSPGRSASAR